MPYKILTILLLLTSCTTTTPPYNLAANAIINTCYDHELTEIENFGRECWQVVN